MGILYGPVPSWRLGRSLGVDAVSSEGKTCSFDCTYCQLGRTLHPLTERRRFVEPADLHRELAQVGSVALDTVTFSGVGEPTLALNLAELVAVVRERFDRPVAVLTNSSLMTRKDVRRDLALFDIVVAKVDAPDEPLFQQINRPVISDTLEDILQGIQCFRQTFPGRLALQMMFTPANRERAMDMAALARRLQPDEVQLNTPLRPSPVSPLNARAMSRVEQAFAGLPVLNVYSATRPPVVTLDARETRRRRPAEGRATTAEGQGAQ
jgi:wyosine [tRNA(Phe)-imidazoG37] synthetase (radical SAM superfamily)